MTSLAKSMLGVATVLGALAGLSVVDANKHFFVRCETTKGPLVIEVFPEWAPIGATRFLDLVHDNFFDDIALYRSVEGFLTQFGISDKPEKDHWHGALIPDDVNLNYGIQKFDISFAGSGPNSRSSQLFIAFEDLPFLGKEPWETPFGKVVEGEDTLAAFYKGYGDIAPFGDGPDQQLLYRDGNAYIHEHFPQTDFINFCEFAGFAEASTAIEAEEVDLLPSDNVSDQNLEITPEDL